MKAMLNSEAPATAIEIAGTRVTVVGLTNGPQGPVVHGWASEPLAPGAVVPSLTALNIVDAGAVKGALDRALSRAGLKARRAALVIPDLAAKVTLVPFDTMPARPDE